MLSFLLLAPVWLVSSVSVLGYGYWGAFHNNDTNNDACLGEFAEGDFLSATNCTPFALRFVGVNVPPKFNMSYAESYLTCGSRNVSVEDVANSLPFTTLAEAQARPWVSMGMECDTWLCDVTSHIQHVVSMDDWTPGNNITLRFDEPPSAEFCDMSSSAVNIFYLAPQGTMSLEVPDTIVPMTGDWVAGFDAASFTNLSVGITNITVTNSYSFTFMNLTATVAFISNGQYTFNCLSVQVTGSGNKRNVTCQLPCAPGSGYRLTLRLCLALQSPYLINWDPASLCTTITASGTINFPSPVLLASTLLPNGRPYVEGAGQPSANSSSQVISNRGAFTATLGVQHICTTELNRWADFSFGNFPISCTSVPRAPPPLAVDDYSTISCSVDACSESMCPEGIPLHVTMRYLGSTLGTTVDSLVYPTFPEISAVSGCEDSPPTTRNCPSSGGVWMNITMSQSSGYIEVFVKVGESECTNVSMSSSNILCLLPPGVGPSRPVTVYSGGYTSSPLYIAYGAPTITRLEGGVGCVPDDFLANSTGGLDNEVCVGSISFGVGVTGCDRNGSDVVPLTIIGDNFGASSVPVTLKLRGVTIEVVKDPEDPHRKLYFKLPPGPGSGAKLALTAMVDLQFVGALVSYEPCPQGQDANCIVCDVGRYGLEIPVCEPCQKGRFQSQPGQATCELCPKGTYQPALGQGRCIPCADQMTTSGVGSEGNEACNSCPLTHYLDSNSSACVPCAPNSIPHGSSCGCVIGFFDARVTFDQGTSGDGANLKCEPCPTGANCLATGTRFASMGPFAGWWRSGLGTFAQCMEAVNCVGVPWGVFSADNASQQMCVSHRSGVLCAECDQGYQSSSLQGGACVPCESSSLAWVWASLFLVLFLIGLLGMGFYFYRRRQVRKMHSEMASLAPTSSSSSSHSSTSQSAPIPPSPTAQQRPQTNTNIHQYGPESEAELPELATRLIHTRKQPQKDTTSTIISTAKILVGFLQILSSMVTGTVTLPSTFAQVIRVFSFLNFDFMPWASIRCVFHINFYTRIYLSCLYPFLMVGLLLLCVALPVALSNKRDFLDEETFRLIRTQFWNQTLTLALFCVFLLYPWVTLQLLQFGICLRVDDKYYLVADMTQLCLEDEWMSHLGPVIGLFCLLSIGIPATLGTLLYRSRGQLRTKRVRQRLGFLYLAYSAKCWWFEFVELSARVSLISIVRCFDPSLHAPLRMICCLAYIMAVLLLTPFVLHSLDSLSLFCMAELMLIACLSNMLPVIGAWKGTFVDDLLSALLLAFFILFFIYMLFQVIRATRWLSHRPWAQRLMRQTSRPSDLQLGSMLSEDESVQKSQASHY